MIDLAALRAAVECEVLAPDDPGFADEVSGFNLAFQQRPDAVVAVTSEADVVGVMRFASEHGIRVRVQATGHGIHGAIDSGILISTKRLDQVSVDADAALATIGAGARWAAVVAAAAPYGLAPITGAAPSVGAVGYLLGGGLGPLARSHGFSSDWVRAVRLVTPAGELVEASAASDTELFWALRGGKGGFGVVTQVTVQLAPIPELYAGNLMFEGDAVRPALEAWLAFTRTAPAEVTTSAALFHFPPIPEVPEPMRGKDIVAIRFARPGDAETGAEIAAPLRAAAPVFMDNLGPMALTEVGLIHNDRAEPGPGWSWGLLLDPIDESFLDAFLGQVGDAASTPFMLGELRHLGSATTRDVAGGSAVGGRDGAYALTMIGAPNPALFETVLPEAATRLRAAIEPWVCASTNINWAGDATEADFRRAWPADTFERLASIRAAVDPDGIVAYGPAAK